MTYILTAVLWLMPQAAWSAAVRPVAVKAPPAPAPAVGRIFAVPSVSLQPSLSVPQLGLTGGLSVVPSIAPAPRAPEPLALPAAMPPAPALAAPAAPAKAAAVEAAAAPRPVLQRLAQDLPARPSAPSNIQSQKDYADRDFAFKLGASDAPGADAIDSQLPADVADIGRRPRKKDPPHQTDDGGGAQYPRREVDFNGRTFPSVALRPNVPVEEKIVEAIEASRESIQIALYEFKLEGILGALRKARKRGVKVEIILDYSNVFPEYDPDSTYHAQRSGQIWGLIRDGFDFTVLRGVTQYGILHNKFAVFDGKMAEFGSYNWSFTAEKSHYENANFTTGKERVKAYGAFWDYLRSISVPFAQAKDHAWPATVPLPPAQAAPRLRFNDVQLPSYLFLPNGTAFEDAVAKAIDAARESVDVAIFALRSTRIVEALARARGRGLTVRVVMDESQSRSEFFGIYAAWLASQGIELRTLAGPDPQSDYPMAEKMHHKFMVLDGKLAQTGSANWTKRASVDNYENANFLDDPTDVAAFRFAFEHLFSIARPYPKPDHTPALPTDAELLNDILHPPPPKPVPPPPPLPSIPAARTLRFNRMALPTSALLPDEPIEPLYVKAINAAKKSIRMAIYEFTSDKILEALRQAQARGVQVEIILDRGHLYTTGIGHEGQPRKPKPEVVALAKEFDMKLLKGKRGGVMHNKFLVLDDKLVSFGSYNLTEVAEDHHFENLMFSTDKKRVANYRRYFKYLRGLSQDIDFEKLEQILNRTAQEAAAEPQSADEESSQFEDSESPQDGDKGHAQFPSPPEDPEQPIAFNGENFPLQRFSPQGHIEATLIRAIQAAKTSIEIAMFTFNSPSIVAALLKVKQEHPEIAIRLILDYSQAKLTKLDRWFASHGFDLRLLAGPAGNEGDPMFEKMHNKFMILDGRLLETGSFNYSRNAENNSFENANFIDDPVDLARYAAHFQRLWLRGWRASAPAESADDPSPSEPTAIIR